jgi:SAM-dependent methyltransferase
MRPEAYKAYHKYFDDVSQSDSLTKFTELIIEHAPPNVNAVADIGCGTGKFTAMVQARLPGRFNMVDPSDEMMYYAYSRMDPHRTTYHPTGFFNCKLKPQDVIIFQRSLYCLGDLDKVAARVRDFAAPGALIAIMEIGVKLSLDAYKEQFGDKPYWSILLEAMLEYNNGIDSGIYKAIQPEDLMAAFGKYFKPIAIGDRPFSFFRGGPASNDS